MTGQQVKDLVEGALLGIKQEGTSRSGSFPYGWGIRWNIDLSQPEGSFLSNIEVNCRAEAAEGWTPLDLAAVYQVVTTDYLASGRDGFAAFGEIPEEQKSDSGILDLDAFVDYVRSLSANGQQLTATPMAEMSLQRYIDANGCDHSVTVFGGCPGAGTFRRLSLPQQ